MKVKEEYEKVREKYKFPSYKEIDEEFEISSIDIEKVNSLPRAILRVVCNKMVMFLNYIEPVVNPNPQNLHAFVEVNNTSNDDKKEIFGFYKDLSYKYHKACGIELTEKENEIVKEIGNVWKDWKDLKANFRKINKIINNAWLKEKEKTEDVS